MHKDRQKPHRIIAIIVAAIILISIVTFAYLLSRQKSPAVPVVNANAGLGEVGAECGGELRLPCKPGNDCRITDAAAGKGVCVKVLDKAPAVQP